MKARNIIPMLAAVLLSAACATPNVAYLTGIEPGVGEAVRHPLEVRVQPDDKLLILVSSRDPQLTYLFNLPVVNRTIGSYSGDSGYNTGSGGSNGLAGYSVDKNGCIDFPVIGEVKVSGMTRKEIATWFKNELISRNLVKDPVVTVEFLNLTVSVLGEVGHPGRVSIDKDRLSLLDALSMAGDLTVYAKRENVLVQREENGKKVIYRVNLNSGRELYDSPVYYLQQNDVIYVEPNGMKARQGTVNGNNLRSASFWMSATSFLTSMLVLILNLTKVTR